MNSIYGQVKHSGMAALVAAVFALLPGAAHLARAQTPLKPIDNPQGGKIVYGQVDGANSLAAAMGTELGKLTGANVRPAATLRIVKPLPPGVRAMGNQREWRSCCI
jgi:hypothetical protein